MIDTTYAAIYTQRMDGDWDFIACFSQERMPAVTLGAINQFEAIIDTFKRTLEAKGEVVKVVPCFGPDMPEVFEERQEDDPDPDE